jgi:hypothetical protein
MNQGSSRFDRPVAYFAWPASMGKRERDQTRTAWRPDSVQAPLDGCE